MAGGKYNQNFLFIHVIPPPMRLRQLLFPVIGLIVPWILILVGIITEIQNINLYVGAIVWFCLGLVFTSALY